MLRGGSLVAVEALAGDCKLAFFEAQASFHFRGGSPWVARPLRPLRATADHTLIGFFIYDGRDQHDTPPRPH